MDETRIDAAPTPAHVFAYRAFRSVFVASPESSPIRPQIAPSNDKENIHLADNRYFKPSTSPPNTKRKSAGKDLLSLTPKRQKTVVISPTKSILKNPNAPTPRRPGIRDINVTFKDIRKSASPDLAQRLTVMSINSQAGLRVASEPLVQLRIAGEVPKVERPIAVSAKTPIDQSIEEEHAAMVADIVRNPAFDVNDYVMKTEKELRRFAAYGKKWKKHAQKQDQKVERLKALLEEAQKENDRLRRKMACADNAKDIDDLQPVVERKTDKLLKKKPFLISKESQDLKPAQKDKDKDKNGGCVLEMADVKPMSNTVVERISSPKHERAHNKDTRRSQQLEVLDARQSHTKAEPSTSTSGRATHLKAKTTKSPAQESTKEDRPPTMPAEMPLRSVSAASSSNAAGRTSMTFDRQAAARERLRLKNEERRASLRLSLAPTGSVTAAKPAVRPLLSIPSVDESELDWADLGQ